MGSRASGPLTMSKRRCRKATARCAPWGPPAPRPSNSGTVASPSLMPIARSSPRPSAGHTVRSSRRMACMENKYCLNPGSQWPVKRCAEPSSSLAADWSRGSELVRHLIRLCGTRLHEGYTFFAERGFYNIDDFTMPLDEAIHQAIHKWMGWGRWNDVILSRIVDLESSLGRLATPREIMRFGAQMRRAAGLSNIKVIPFGG